MAKASPGEAARYLVAHLEYETDDCILWPYYRNRKGYGQIIRDGRMIGVHQLACAHAHGPKPGGHEVRHACRNKHCFNPRHLRWGTSKENGADMVRDGTSCRGERHGNAKLTASDVGDIRERYRLGRVSQQALADEYGVHFTHISKIVRGDRWR